jgi:hypothetical protein
MKVVILSDWDSRLPEILRPYYKGDDESWRWGEVIKFIEKSAMPWDQTYRPEKNTKAIMKYDCSYMEEGVTVYRAFGREGTITFKLVDVDITRPWTICEYDSSEYVQYLDIIPVEPKVNFYKLPDYVAE